jgi:hypothetical protein
VVAKQVRERRPRRRVVSGRPAPGAELLREEVTAQVRRHLLTLLALPLAHLTHPGLWMQRRALTLLVGCPAAGRLSSGRRPAGHTTAPA